MKVLFFFFLFLNVLIYYWPSSVTNSNANASTTSLPAGVNELVLVDEGNHNGKRSNTKKSKQKLALAKARKQTNASKRVKKTSPKRSSTRRARQEDVCYALGPFVAKDQVRSIAEKLEDLGADTVNRKEKARVPIGYWVYLPKFSSWNAARRKVVALEDLGMTDAFIMGKGRMKNAVSLGLFKAEKAAKRRMKKLAGMGVSPKLETQYTVDERYWIDIDVASGKSQVIDAIETIARGLTVLDLLPRKCS